MGQQTIHRRAFLGACGAALAWRPGRGAAQTSGPRRVAAQATPRALVLAHPRLEALPWLDLGGLATRVHPLPGVGGVFLKRDDLAGVAYGGSKARKLELLLGEAVARGHDHVVTYGAPASNHALATAVHARRLGLACTLLVLPGPGGERARHQLLAAQRLGARLVAARREDVRDPEGARARHGIPARAAFVPLGGTSALGDVGYVNAGFELAAQVAEGTLPAPDHVVIAAGTGGAAAGLAVGLRAAGLRARLVAVRTSTTATGARVRREAAEVAALLHRLDPTFPTIAPAIDFDGAFLGPGYGRPSEPGERARRFAVDRGGLRLDSTYTAKAFAALLARRSEGTLRGCVLFVHTSDERSIDVGATTPADLPPALRAYAR